MSDKIVPVRSEQELQIVEAASIIVKNNRDKLMNKPTDKGYIKMKPGGGDVLFPYVPAAYMDNEFKNEFPFYEITVTHIDVQWNSLWVWCMVSITDRRTGNVEAGAGAARIQIKLSAKASGVIDYTGIVDFDKNIKSALTNAIKNAQSRFGICADVYQKVIVPPEVEAAWKEEYIKILNEGYDQMISVCTNPIKKVKLQQEKLQLQNAWDSYKGSKKELLEDMRERFGVEIDESTE